MVIMAEMMEMLMMVVMMMVMVIMVETTWSEHVLIVTILVWSTVISRRKLRPRGLSCLMSSWSNLEGSWLCHQSCADPTSYHSLTALLFSQTCLHSWPFWGCFLLVLKVLCLITRTDLAVVLKCSYTASKTKM